MYMKRKKNKSLDTIKLYVVIALLIKNGKFLSIILKEPVIFYKCLPMFNRLFRNLYIAEGITLCIIILALALTY